MDDYIEIKDENGLTDLAPLNGPNELVTQLLFNMLVIIGAKDNFIRKSLAMHVSRTGVMTFMLTTKSQQNSRKWQHQN